VIFKFFKSEFYRCFSGFLVVVVGKVMEMMLMFFTFFHISGFMMKMMLAFFNFFLFLDFFFEKKIFCHLNVFLETRDGNDRSD
jgi:hypothetical protein